MTRNIYKEMNLSLSLRKIGIPDDSKFDEMAEKAMQDGLEEAVVPMSKEDVAAIYRACF